MTDSTTPITASQQRILDYLEQLAAEGKPVPTIRAIREAVRVSPNEITQAMKIWKMRQSEAQSRAINEVTAKVIDEDVSKTLDAAMAQIRTAIVNAVSAATEKYAEADKVRTENFAAKEATLIERAEIAEKKLHDAHIDIGRYSVLLDGEVESRKRAEKIVEDLRNTRDKLETQLEESHIQNAKLETLCESQKNELEALKIEIEALKKVVNSIDLGNPQK